MIKSEKLLLKLPSYTDAEQIFEVSGCKVFRTRRKQDNESVLIKWLGHNGHFQWFESLLQHEYEVSRKLALPGIIRPRQLIEQSDVLALIMEDVSSGMFLQTVLEVQQPNFKVSLGLIVQLAEILHDLHQNKIVHKDIRPANILVDTINWKLHLTGFGMASTHLQDRPVFSSSLAYLDHLAYISPEQTGRMNCDVDYRSDFYSLGITLYQLLTGQLPFNRSERLALIHDHLAVRPVSVRELCPDIPESVSAIVDKLLQKQPEERYQSAAGLKRDLQICASQWRESGTVIEFQLAEDDFFEQFLIPTKLYGREHTINLLE